MSLDFSMVYAPWTPKQVENLYLIQWSPDHHPFTCPNRGSDHSWHHTPDLGALIPTIDGWICQYCDYTQDWVYGFMLDGPPWGRNV